MDNLPAPENGPHFPNLRDLLNRINAESTTTTTTLDPNTQNIAQDGLDAFEKDARRLKNKQHKAHLKSFKQNIKERKQYASKIFVLISVWLLFTALITLNCAKGTCNLSDNVLIALLTTSSANVIMIFIYVAKYLFNHEKV